MTEATLAKLAESINQYAASAVTSLVVPEFSGAPNEDVKEFMSRFKTSTITLSDEMKCLALAKSLTGSAKIWAKENLKADMLTCNWKAIKKALKQRFADLDSDLKHLEKLSKLKFEPDETTLISYLEKFALYYKSAHKEAKDCDIVRALKLNLPRNVVKGLNMLNDEWVNFQDIKQLYTLARRVEDKILAYEARDEPITATRAEDITKMLVEMRKAIDANKEAKEDLNKSTEKLAAVTEGRNPRNAYARAYQQGPGNSTSRYDQPLRHCDHRGPRIQNEFQNFGRVPPNRFRSRNADGHNSRPVRQPRVPGNSWAAQNGPPAKLRAVEPAKVTPAIADKTHVNQEPRAPSDPLIQRYVEKYGEPPSPCHHCGGHHFNRHCAYHGLN